MDFDKFYCWWNFPIFKLIIYSDDIKRFAAPPVGFSKIFLSNNFWKGFILDPLTFICPLKNFLVDIIFFCLRVIGS